MNSPHADLVGSKPGFFAKHRVEALADALFAIVMTLLVLDLKVPELEHNATARALLHAISLQRRALFSFVLTFVLASVFWMLQQKILKLVHNLDRVGTFLSLAPMLFVSLLPYSTATFARYPNNSAASTLYFGNQFAIALFLACFWFQTRSVPVESDAIREHSLLGIRVMTLTMACLLAALISVVEPKYAFIGFLFAIAGSRVAIKRISSPAREDNGSIRSQANQEVSSPVSAADVDR